MKTLLYRWPSAAKFGRVVPKVKFYEHGGVSTAVREKFVSEVQRITWAYKLAESTVNLPSSISVPEIQVFEIYAKGGDVSESVLTAIDKSIKTLVIFEIAAGEGANRRTRMAATHKQLVSGAPKLGRYLTTGWQDEDAERKQLPASISLSALYIALLEPLTPASVHPGDEVADVAERIEGVRRLERSIAALERKLRTEPQFNRKIELRRQLKARQAEYEHMR